MRHHLVRADSDRFRTLCILPPRSTRDLYSLTGAPAGASWQPLPVEWEPLRRRDKGVKVGNFAQLISCLLTMDKMALDALGPLLDPHVEWLPLEVQRGMPALFTAHPLRSLECLDMARAEEPVFYEGRLLGVNRYAFLPEIIGDLPIFRIRHLELSHVFVSEAVVDVVQTHALQGLIFEEVV